MLQTAPERSGYVEKKSNSWTSFLLPCFYPRWRRRFLVVVGSFVFRFESEHGERPKGVPIPVESITVTVLEDGLFVLSTLRKQYHFRVDSKAEAERWANAIRARKFLAIKENMGHAPVRPEVKNFNSLGVKLFDEKLKADKAEYDMSYNPMSVGM